ncbi:MAG: serine/threonine protein kinase [Sandaracinaceae bacterium]
MGEQTLSAKGRRYAILDQIAAGGMATVYEARVLGPVEQRVALKRIHPHLSGDAAFRDMFLDEARIVARIEHPNVCRILDYGDTDEGAYIAMELLSGVTVQAILAQLARQRPDDDTYFRFVTTLIIEAAEGLHAAHEVTDDDGVTLDIVHRDISPSNLFVTHDGRMKVLDFGIAKARNRIHVSTTDEVKGKYSYMAPEQLHGRAERRSDVWSLGVVYYEMLTLSRLFRRNSQPETIIAVEREPVRPVGEIRGAIANRPTDVVLEALSRDIDGRPESAQALADRLHEVLEPVGGAMTRREIEHHLHEVMGTEASDRSPVSRSGKRSVAAAKPAANLETELGAEPTQAEPTPERTASTVRSSKRPSAEAPHAPEGSSPSPRPSRGAGTWLALGATALAIVGGLAAWTGTGVDAPAAPATSDDAGPADAGALDSRPRDAGPSDAGPPDAGPPDTPPADIGPSDTAPGTRGTQTHGTEADLPRPIETGTPREPPGERVAPPPPGTLVVPMGVSICLQPGCSRVLDGPMRHRTEAGQVQVFYVEQGSVPPRRTGSVTIRVPSGGSVTVPRGP